MRLRGQGRERVGPDERQKSKGSSERAKLARSGHKRFSFWAG